MVEQLFPNVTDELAEIITDGPNDQGIDAIHIVENERYAQVFLIQSKYRESPQSSKRTINDTECLKVCSFLTSLFEKSEGLEQTGNFALDQAVKRIWGLHEAGKICRYQIVWCSNGGGLSTSADGILSEFCKARSNVTSEFYGPSKILSGILSEDRHPEAGQLQVIGKEIHERSDGDVRGVIASVDARSFIELILNEHDSTIKRHVFADNLRVFLGSSGGFNASIIETASSDDSYLFWYLNNGITITCRNFSYNKGHSSPVLVMDDFQIVNGAQTSHSLLEATRLNPNAIEDVVLMVRVYATERDDIAQRVAVATNSQAKIQGRDLRSNEPILKKIEVMLSERDLFFERKRNLHSDKPEEQRVDALKLGQMIMAFSQREPHRAKTDSDSIFDTRFTQVFHDRIDAEEIYRLISLYKIIERLRDEYTSKFGDSPESGHPHQYLIYGHWFVLTACRLLMIKDAEQQIPIGDSAKTLVERAIALVAEACGQHKAVAHYQMFRSARTLDKIIAECSGKQTDFFDLLASV